jgi:hypothetical protein
MNLKRMRVAALLGVATSLLVIVAGSLAAVTTDIPQHVVAEEWAAAIRVGDQRDACELQAVGDVTGQSCATLPVEAPPRKCPKPGPDAKPNYRKSELRTAAEQVGEFTAESPTRGFIKIYAQIKAKKLWGSLGLELDASGSWRVNYFRYADETFAPAGTAYQSEAWRKLWVGSMCRTSHPQWEQNGVR